MTVSSQLHSSPDLTQTTFTYTILLVIYMTFLLFSNHYRMSWCSMTTQHCYTQGYCSQKIIKGNTEITHVMQLGDILYNSFSICTKNEGLDFLKFCDSQREYSRCNPWLINIFCIFTVQPHLWNHLLWDYVYHKARLTQLPLHNTTNGKQHI